MDTDLIASARRDGSTQQVYVAREAASRLDRDDVKRVGETGEALARVFPDAEVLTAVYGSEVSEEDRRHAHADGVEVFLVPA